LSTWRGSVGLWLILRLGLRLGVLSLLFLLGNRKIYCSSTVK
jgi:hypothetical protein